MKPALLDLPVHPTMRHPLTGQPVRALYVDRHGRARWPMMGGAPDDPPAGGGSGTGGEGGGAGGQGGQGGDGGRGGSGRDSGDAGGDLGYPKDTPLTEMTTEQREAYWTHQARRHETRFKGLSSAVGGKTAEQIKADYDELERLRQSSRSDAENAVEEAKKSARSEAESEWMPKLVRTALDGRLTHMKQDERDDLIDTLDLSKFVLNGELDTEKLDKFAQRHTQPGTGTTRRWPDTGQGNRGGGSKPSGVSAGADMFAESRKKK